jgi:hypothetical protein
MDVKINPSVFIDLRKGKIEKEYKIGPVLGNICIKFSFISCLDPHNSEIERIECLLIIMLKELVHSLLLEK